jgi:UDP-N-acetylmuramate--alanine ligase
MKSIYFIGIGGIGMSGLARYYKAKGYRVSGSDAADGPIVASLRKDAIRIKIGHKKGNLPTSGVDLVIFNRAIPAENLELMEARRRSMHVIPYAEALGELTEQYQTIAITGSHGKSTTTALAALALIRAGLDPTVLVGTNLKEFGGKNIRVGKRDGHKVKQSGKNWLILEADDYGGAFWSYSPFISIVTNIDREHLDFYKNLAGVKKSFLKFIGRTVSGGALILNRDDKNLFSLKSEILAITKKKDIRVVWYSMYNDHRRAGGLNSVTRKIKKIIKISGEHNVSNAMAIYELGKILKNDEKKVLAGIGAYRGAWRRMEYRGAWNAVKIYDDYAHHPTEIMATLQAFREKFPALPLVCVFQPHQTKRLKALFREFVGAFTDADALVLIPSYTVAGRDGGDARYTAEYLAGSIKKKYPKKLVRYLPNPARIKEMLKTILCPAPDCCYDACVIMMGAGDIVNYTDKLVGLGRR